MKGLRQLLLISLMIGFGCNSPQPDVIEARFPGDTFDEGGPYQVSVHTWGPVDSIQILYDTDDMAEALTQTAPMDKVQANQWAGSIPGARRGSTIAFRLKIKGPGGTILYPRSSPHRFSILGEALQCNPECIEGESCIDGRCRRQSICLNDGQCQMGERCQRGQCVPDLTRCESDEDCPDSLRCNSGSCTPECSDARDCLETERCNNGRCEDVAPDCLDDSQCSPGEVCTGGECQTVVDGPCPEDCPEPLFCAEDLGDALNADKMGTAVLAPYASKATIDALSHAVETSTNQMIRSTPRPRSPAICQSLHAPV